MSDLHLKERLRHRSTMMRVDNPDAKLMDEAADRLAALEDALREIAELTKRQSLPLTYEIHGIATRLLTQGDA